MNTDGSIRIGTKVDTTGAEKDLAKLQKECEKTAQSIADAGTKLKTAFSGMTAKQLEASLAKANKELEKTIALQAKAEEEGQAITDSYKPMYDAAKTEEQRGVIDEMAEHELQAVDARWAQLNAKAEEYKQNISEITAALMAARQAEDAKNAEAEEAVRVKKREKEATKEAEKRHKEYAKTATRAARQVAQETKKGFRRMMRLSIAVLGVESAFTILRRATNSYMEDNEELEQQINSIWNVLGVAIGPAIESLVSWLTVGFTYINEFVKALTGIDYIAQANAKALRKQAKATTEAAKASRQLAGFDEQTKLSDTSGSAGGAGGGTAATFKKADIGNFDAAPILEKLQEIAGIVGVATLALGAVLAFSGANIPLGIGLMIAGAGILAAEATLNWKALSTQTTDVYDLIAVALSTGLLVFGALFAFSGANIPLGIGLMIAGAAGLAGEVAINWNATSGPVGDVIETITTVAGGALLAIGAILAFSGGNIPLGIGLMAAGALSLAAGVTMNWNECADSTAKTIEKITTVVGGLMLGLGAVLAFSGTNIPLGIGLMAAGAASLAAILPTKWNKVPDQTKETITGIAIIAGGALLVLGVVLAFSGVAIPLGLGLMAAGAATLTGSIAAKWNSLSDKTKNTLSIISAVAGGALLALGVILLLTGAGIPLGLGLIAAGAGGLAAAITPNWNSIVNWLKKPLNAIVGLFEGLVNGIVAGINGILGVINKIPGVEIPKIPRVNWTKLAQGGIVNNPGRGVPIIAGEAGSEAVLPLDRNTEWMDILADKINGGGGKPIVVQVILSGKKIHEEIIQLSKKREFATNGVI